MTFLDNIGYYINRNRTYKISLTDESIREGFVDNTLDGKVFKLTGESLPNGDARDSSPQVQVQDADGKYKWINTNKYKFTFLSGGTRRRKHRRRKTKLIRKYR